MTHTKSCLTWFEEWMLFFEMMWGKTHTRVEDLIATYHIEKNKPIIQSLITSLTLCYCVGPVGQLMHHLKKMQSFKKKNGMKNM